jgi:hypothetical protein
MYQCLKIWTGWTGKQPVRWLVQTHLNRNPINQIEPGWTANWTSFFFYFCLFISHPVQPSPRRSSRFDFQNIEIYITKTTGIEVATWMNYASYMSHFMELASPWIHALFGGFKEWNINCTKMILYSFSTHAPWCW